MTAISLGIHCLSSYDTGADYDFVLESLVFLEAGVMSFRYQMLFFTHVQIFPMPVALFIQYSVE